jgi:hypothetical protein
VIADARFDELFETSYLGADHPRQLASGRLPFQPAQLPDADIEPDLQLCEANLL